jgi:murein DD-endopeptidase MepM/ murein hydrolase activator NlpD
MVIQSPLGLRNISQGLIETRRNVSASVTSANRIAELIENRTKVKSDIFRRGTILRSRRQEASKRQEMEDEIEAGKIDASSPGGRNLFASRLTGGFLSRILNTIGALGIGWLVNNLPTWIAMGTEFIARIRKTGELIGGFVGNIVNLIRGFGNAITSLASNLARFDLFDTSGKVQSAFDELNFTIENMGNQLQEGFKMLLTPLSEGIESGQDAPGLGQDRPETLYPDVDTGSGSGGGGRWKPLLDIIASVESSTDRKNNGYDAQNGAPRGVRPGLSKMTIGEIARTAPGASGRYQQMPQFLLGRAKAAGFNENTVFSPQVQDVLAIKQIEGRGGNTWLAGRMPTETFMQGLSQEWAALPNAYGSFYYKNQSSSLRPERIKSALDQVKKGSATPSTNINVTGMPTAFQPAQIQQGRRFRGGENVTGSVGRGVSYVQITDAFGARGGSHKGVDIAAPSGTYIALRYDSEVVASGWYGDYGYLIDLWVPSLGVQLRFAHLLQKPSVNSRIPAGISFARVGSTGRSTGPHIHFEFDTKKGSSRYGGAGDPSPYVSALLLTKTPNQGSFTVPEVSATPQIAPRSLATSPSPITPAQFIPRGELTEAERLAAEYTQRKGNKVYLVQTTAPTGPKMISGSRDRGITQTISEFDLVNNFMKNKLLLDLAYL